VKKYLLSIGAVTAIILSGAVSTANAGLLYAINNTNNTLVTFDTNTLAQNVVGSLGTNISFGGAAYDPNSDTMYLIDGRGANNSLFTVNRTTGAASLVGSHGVNDLFGLAYDSMNNVLYGSQFSGGRGLYSLDTGTGAATVINSAMGVGIGGLAYNSLTDQLIGIRDGSGDLYDINRTTGGQSLLFNGASVNDSGLTYDPDLNLYWDIDFNGNLFSYDPNNGFARTTHLSGLGSFDGLTYLTTAINTSTNVPEPAPLALLGFGLLGLGFMRRRKA